MSIREMLIKFLANRLGHGVSATGGAMREQTTREWATHRAARSEPSMGALDSTTFALSLLLAKRPRVTCMLLRFFILNFICSFAHYNCTTSLSANCMLLDLHRLAGSAAGFARWVSPAR